MEVLSTFIARNADHLVDEFVARLRALGASGGDVLLRDHLPHFLRDLARALAVGSAEISSPTAAEHGAQRFAVGFSLEILVREYRLLLDTVIEAAAVAALHPSGPEMRVMSGFFVDGIAAGVIEHDAARREADEAAKRRELEAARRSESELRLVVDALPLLISFVAADERYGLVNKAYESWFGIDRDQLVGKTLLEVLGPAAYAVLLPHVRRALAGERFTSEEHDVPYRLGGTRDIRVTFVPRVADGGAVEGYVAVLEDITTQRRLTRERERLAEQRTEVLEAMGDVFFAVDAGWKIRLINERFLAWTDRPRDAVIGADFWELFEQPEWADAYRACMRDRVPHAFTARHQRLQVWLQVSLVPAVDGGMSVFFRDVTAVHEASETLRHQTEFEQQLIGIVSHDLRNPLNVIQLSTDVLLRDESLGAGHTKLVMRVKNAVSRATDLVADLLDFTKARLGGGIPVDKEPAELQAVVRAVVDETAVAWPDRAITVVVDGDTRGCFDPARLAQVVQNLVGNALQYGDPSRPVHVEAGGDDGTLRLVVHNHGAPIPAAVLPTLFEPLQRGVVGDNARRSVGLGLYIVKRVIEAHGGTIGVASSADAGTTFTVTVPRAA